MKLLPYVAISAICFSLSAQAGELKDKKRWEQATKEVESVKVETEKSCSASFKFSFDKETFTPAKELAKMETQGMNGYCGDAFAAMGDLCADEDYRKALGKVKSVSCAFDGKLTKPDANLEEGHLRFTFNWDTANHRRLVREYLENSL